MYFDPTDRPALKAYAKRCMRAAAPNIYLVAILCLVLINAPTLVTEGPTLRLMLQADSLEQAMEIYENGGAVGGHEHLPQSGAVRLAALLPAGLPTGGHRQL